MEASIYENYWSHDWWVMFQYKDGRKVKIFKTLPEAKKWCQKKGLEIKIIVYN